MNIVYITNTKSAILHLIYYLQVYDINVNTVVIEDKDSDKYFLLKEYSGMKGFNLSFVNDVNSQNTYELVKRLSPDLGIIMLSKILRGPIINVPPLGILNVHAGVLPYYRGVDSRRWAILMDGDIGCSVHYVNEAVDLGDIILVKKLNLKEGDTIESISRRNYYKNRYQALVESIKQITNGNVKASKQIEKDGKQYFWMHEDLRKIVDEKLKVMKYD